MFTIKFTKNKDRRVDFLKIRHPQKFFTGFTLIEMLVSVGIFIIIVGVICSVFTSTLKNQKRTLAYQELLDQTGYAVEYMSRLIRTVTRDEDGTCLSSAGLNYEKVNTGAGGIRFIWRGECREFFREWNSEVGVYQLKERRNIGTADEKFLELTSDKINVVLFNIGPDDSWDVGDTDQPRVTLSFEIKGAVSSSKEQPVVRIQTMISQRNLDYTY